MRDSAGRTEKYRKKIRGLVIPGQTERYAPTAQDRLHLEYCVKREAITPMLQFSYVAFCEELLKHEASKRPVEAQGIYNKWLNRGLDATTLQSVASCIGVSIVIPAPPICAWSWKRKLTFSGNVSATNLDDFPVLVHLTVANFDFNKARPLGQDIRFMDSDTCPSDGTPLKHEIEFWDKPNSQAWVWVKVPRINGGTVNDFIYMFYGNNAAADGQDVPNTWNANFKMVHHMYDNPDNQHIADSTAPAYNGTKVLPNEPIEANAKIYKGQDFDGSNDYIKMLNVPVTASGAATVSVWIYPTDFNTAGEIFRFGNSFIEGRLAIQVITGGQLQVFFHDGAGKGIISPAAVTADNWFHITVTVSQNNLRLYVNGVEDANSPTALDGSWSGATDDLWIGVYFTLHPTSFYPGLMDEIRVQDSVMSDDWIMAQFKTQDETLVTYGAEEPA